MRPFTSARTKKTTKKFAKFFVQTSNIPERIAPAVARRGGGLGKYGYAATAAAAPGGGADGYRGSERETPRRASSWLPAATAESIAGSFRGPPDAPALAAASARPP